MELSEFVEETLAQILQGVRAAQKREDGTNIAAEGMYGKITDHLLITGDAAFTVVDFDVSVVAETKGGGKGGIKVWGIEAGGGIDRAVQNTSKVKFAVHLMLPTGAKQPPASPLPERNKDWVA
ncbi:trypco2 family protein [Microvirga sp. BSC39]|uniref:trypco2 family protein n=1 Tax=Microvirga sp. BSC39 TaxID=1549810 RepID=UPI0004E95D12|nr:trypco2 family protein [Microvirga sp. BSC39]KFG66730.1 hypothetical protein JH26_25600 [Microvirga sp. BSC39]